MGLILLAFFVISLGFGYYLISHDRGPLEPVSSVLLALVMGVICAIVASYLEEVALPGLSVTSPLSFSTTLVVGGIEEGVKFLPLAWFLFRKPYFAELTDGVIYFGICGLGFGLIENIGYTLTYGTAAGIERLVLLPFFHAATSGIIGFYLARYKLRLCSLITVIEAALGMVLVHSYYDYLISHKLVVLGGTLTFLATVTFFRLYRRASLEDSSRRGGVSGLSLNGPLPQGIKKWSWPAFLLNWIWAIAHDSWLGLLVVALPVFAILLHNAGSVASKLVPVTLLAVIPVLVSLGMSGNAIAWRNRKFDSYEDFQEIEKIWTRWALWLTSIGVIGIFLVVIRG